MRISAKVLAHSKSSITGKEVMTFEIVYPRMILAELNTHKMLNKNSASSRAIPVSKVLESVRDNPAAPMHWGKNQPGMSASEELTGTALINVQALWLEAALDAADHAEAMSDFGAHKQVANRILEPFQWMKTVITGTEWDNLFHLRRHPDADPTFHALMDCMWEAKQSSKPFVLNPGEWHVPYVHVVRAFSGEIEYWDFAGAAKLTLEQALKVSSSCCAQTSFRTNDDALDKAERVYDRLVESKPVHASPFEHQATPIEDCEAVGGMLNVPYAPASWEQGITHIDRQGRFWSANLCGFIQHRQLIPDHTCWEYKEIV